MGACRLPYIGRLVEDRDATDESGAAVHGAAMAGTSPVGRDFGAAARRGLDVTRGQPPCGMLNIPFESGVSVSDNAYLSDNDAVAGDDDGEGGVRARLYAAAEL